MSIAKLELVYRRAKQDDAVPVLFVHGIFCGAWVWEEHFLDWFSDQGYHAYALSVRGHGRSSAPDRLGQYTLSDYVEDLEDAIRTIEFSHQQKPLLVGHSMGGMVVQRYLNKRQGQGAVLVCSVPPQGMVPLSWQSFWQEPLLTIEMTQTYLMPELATTEQLRRYLFAGPVAQDKLELWLSRLVPESQRLLWDMSWGNLPNPFEVRKTPIAVVGALQDRLIPKVIVNMTAATYNCKPRWIESGHGVMLDHNWQASAQVILDALADVQRQNKQADSQSSAA